MLAYLLVAVMIGSLVYVIYLMGEYRPSVEESELKILRLQDQIAKLAKDLAQDGKVLSAAQEKLGATIDRHDDLQQTVASTLTQLREAKALESRLEASKLKLDYKRSPR